MQFLDLKNCGGLQNHHLINIDELFHLRYLSLEGTAITELPEQIGELEYLETLDLRCCQISKLPTTMVGLKRPVNLLVATGMPNGIRSMQSLELVIVYDIKRPSRFLEEIGELTKMRNLDIRFRFDLDTVKCYMEDIKRMFSSVQQLNKLTTFSSVSCVIHGH